MLVKLAETSSLQFPCSTKEAGLKNAKLGIEETREELSKSFKSPLLWNENPLDDEKDDMQVNAVDWVSQITGEPAPKLMSWFLDIKEVENEQAPTSHSSILWFAIWLGRSGNDSLLVIHKWSTKSDNPSRTRKHEMGWSRKGTFKLIHQWVMILKLICITLITKAKVIKSEVFYFHLVRCKPWGALCFKAKFFY